MKEKMIMKLSKLFVGKVDTPLTYASILGYMYDKQKRGKKTIDGRALYKYNPSCKTTYKTILRNMEILGVFNKLYIPELDNRVMFEINEDFIGE